MRRTYFGRGMMGSEFPDQVSDWSKEAADTRRV
jgi:hypothetical protein